MKISMDKKIYGQCMQISMPQNKSIASDMEITICLVPSAESNHPVICLLRWTACMPAMRAASKRESQGRRKTLHLKRVGEESRSQDGNNNINNNNYDNYNDTDTDDDNNNSSSSNNVDELQQELVAVLYKD